MRDSRGVFNHFQMASSRASEEESGKQFCIHSLKFSSGSERNKGSTSGRGSRILREEPSTCLALLDCLCKSSLLLFRSLRTRVDGAPSWEGNNCTWDRTKVRLDRQV